VERIGNRYGIRTCMHYLIKMRNLSIPSTRNYWNIHDF
jgi:hypothetical protein